MKFMFMSKDSFEAVLEDRIQLLVKSFKSYYEAPLDEIKTHLDLIKKNKQLRDEVENLKIEKSQREESFARQEREIEHKIGLLKVQQAFELEKSKSELNTEFEKQKIKIREDNLKEEKQRFEAQLKFHEDRFATEVKYLKDMNREILDRLPSVDVSVKKTIKES